MKYLRKFNESLEEEDPCRKINWVRYTQEVDSANFIKISNHSINVAKKMIIRLEGLMGHGFDELDFYVSANITDNYTRIDYQRLGINIRIYEDDNYWFYVDLRLSDCDRWVRRNFSSRDVTYHWMCDQDTGLAMIPDRLIEDIKSSGYGKVLESKDSMCELIPEEEYMEILNKLDDEGKPWSIHSSNKIMDIISTQLEKIEAFYNYPFSSSRLTRDSFEGNHGDVDTIEYLRKEKSGNVLFIRFSELEDSWFLIDFNDRNIDNMCFKCDQDTGLSMFADTVIPLIKKEYDRRFGRMPILLESNNSGSLVVPITVEEYNDVWVKERYVGLPNEKAKWTMIESIKLFEESLAHQSSKLSGKYDDNNMFKAYMDTHLDPGYKKLQWTYHRITSSVSDFEFSMFEGDDYWFIIRLYINYHYYHYKVDDIVGIESLYESIKKTREDFFW